MPDCLRHITRSLLFFFCVSFFFGWREGGKKGGRMKGEERRVESLRMMAGHDGWL